jgi:hypothetical protein
MLGFNGLRDVTYLARGLGYGGVQPQNLENDRVEVREVRDARELVPRRVHGAEFDEFFAQLRLLVRLFCEFDQGPLNSLGVSVTQ